MCKILVIMGVCGCGKTTVARSLAETYELAYHEADDFHSVENKSKMAAGVPLTDTDRWPWLLSLHEQLKIWKSSGISGVMTCSALKRMYRDVLLRGTDALPEQNLNIHSVDESSQEDTNQLPGVSRGTFAPAVTNSATLRDCTLPENIDPDYLKDSSACDITFVYLKGSFAALSTRLRMRSGHYMPESLLASQLDILEEPQDDERSFTVDIAEDLQSVVRLIASNCGLEK